MNSTKAIAVMLGIMTLLLSNLYFPSYSLAQSRDPHRGLTVTRFLQFTPASINSGYPRVSLSFSILGTAREDSLLSYARDNHITYLEIYDLHRVFRYNDSAGTILPNGKSLIDGLCDFITKAKNNYCITEVGVSV
jgi:hypothetical protein